MGYDAWKTTEPDQRRYERGGAVTYHCTQCQWRGKAAQAAEHHQQGHHRIALANGLITEFSCCKGQIATQGAA
jgi:DNA topoisomerase IA